MEKTLLQTNGQNSQGSACVRVSFLTKPQAATFFLRVFLWFSMLIFFSFFIKQLSWTDSASEEKAPGGVTDTFQNLPCQHWYIQEPEVDWVYCCDKTFYSMETLQGSFCKLMVNKRVYSHMLIVKWPERLQMLIYQD